MTALALLAATACPLFATGPAQEHPIALPGGDAIVARDPYGGTLARNRLFFDFSLQGDTARVAKAQWALDGNVIRTDDRAPFEWRAQSGSKRRMPAGEHTITVTAFTAGGAQASTQFKLTATDCQNAGADVFLPRRPGTARLGASSTGEPPPSYPPFQTLSFTARQNVAVHGRARGTLDVVTASGTRHYRFSNGLRRGGLRLAFHPGAKRFLTVTGLPKGTRSATVHLTGGVVRIVQPTHLWRIDATLTGGGNTATVPSGGAYA